MSTSQVNSLYSRCVSDCEPKELSKLQELYKPTYLMNCLILVAIVMCALALDNIDSYNQTLYYVAGCFLGPECYNCSAPVCGEVYKSGIPMGNYCFGNSWCLERFNNTCGQFGSSQVYVIDMSGCLTNPGGNGTCTIMENLPKC